MSDSTIQADAIVYPESDGKPMADNTLQWEWMVRIVGELREQFKGQNVFVAGDLFWYPVQGEPRTFVAPDGLVVFGRPPGYRGSYKQWEEDGLAPQVVFEVLSPNNTDEEMTEKARFYDRHGVEEYYLVDPYENTVEIHHRRGELFVNIRRPLGWVSPRLGTHFFRDKGELFIKGPDGRVFQDREERVQEILEELRKTSLAFEEEHTRAIEESARAEAEAARAEAEAARAVDAERARELLANKLRELGVNPDELLRNAG